MKSYQLSYWSADWCNFNFNLTWAQNSLLQIHINVKTEEEEIESEVDEGKREKEIV